ncbi:hypothetical protein L1987_15823 [Smallanthus sonchifolius]|uniref:Uncharacterized protein n=1 Tax=Smallanthus sonchifolius TaxID=185202 RepID=A0ACB9J862_9ASTR|nr:hypothetical protein L1987_15823 [Smallanthus sonchifolius]
MSRRGVLEDAVVWAREAVVTRCAKKVKVVAIGSKTKEVNVNVSLSKNGFVMMISESGRMIVRVIWAKIAFHVKMGLKD